MISLKTPTPPSPASSFDGKVCSVPTERMFPNPSQPRFVFDDEPMLRLADSIRRYGVLQPLAVRPATTQGFYQIIAGERRWRAARIIGLSEIPCIILDIDSQKSAELALIENIQREDLNIFEQAAAIASLIDIYGLTQEQAARQLSSSQAFIANKLRILKLTPPERSAIIKNRLTERHARALLRLTDPTERLNAISHIAAHDLNVSSTERYVDRLLAEKTESDKTGTIKPHLKDLRFFYNSIDKAIDILKACGFTIATSKTEHPTSTELTIHISRKY